MQVYNILNDEEAIKSLSSKETTYYFEKYKNEGDLDARKILISHNILFVSYISAKFAKDYYGLIDFEEFFEVGLEGLIKAVDTFDIGKSNAFTTYAFVCINNQIKMFLRKAKKYILNSSFETVLATDKDGNNEKLEGKLKDSNVNIESDYESKETILIIRELVELLPDRDKEIIKLYYGFYDNRCYTQSEISEKVGLSQVYISRLILKIIRLLRIELESLETYSSKKSKLTESLKKSFPN